MSVHPSSRFPRPAAKAALPLAAALLLVASGALAAAPLPSALPALADQPATTGLAAAAPPIPLGSGAPLFEANLGQHAAEALFMVRGSGGTSFLTADGVVSVHRGLPVLGEPGAPEVVRMTFDGARPAAPRGVGETGYTANYYVGDASTWRAGVPHFQKVLYEGLYPGTDALFYGTPAGDVEYDLIVAPGADPGAIRLSFAGATLALDAAGDAVFQLSSGPLRHRAPVTYQEAADGSRVPVASRFALAGDGALRFALGPYDASRPLVIDPLIQYSTFLGGSGSDSGHAIVVDGAGSAYVVGRTSSNDFPTLNAQQPNAPGSTDAFVTKYTSSGALSYSTYLGGSAFDHGEAIAVDAAGNVYVTGETSSANFPVLNADDPTRPGLQDAFVTKLTAAGAIAYSTYLGGTNRDRGNDIGVDASGNAYITGETNSADFPAIGSTHNGNYDAFVAKYTSAGARTHAIFLGGGDTEPGQDASEYGEGLAVGADGNVYLTGFTYSYDFPVQGPYQDELPGWPSVFVTKLGPQLSILYSTYLGGVGDDRGADIAVDADGQAHVVGRTNSGDFPVQNALQSTHPTGGGNLGVAFLTKLDSTGAGLVYSTYIGGNNADEASAVAVDAAGNAYVTGHACSTNFPMKNAAQATNAACKDGFVSKFDPAGGLTYSTYLGGTGTDHSYGIAVDADGNALVTGSAGSTSATFPLVNAAQTSKPPPGPIIAFVTKFAPSPSKPLGLSVGSATGTTVVLDWSAPAFDDGVEVTNYRVYRGATASGTLLTTGGCSSLGDVLTCTDSGLTAGQTYMYQVSAVNDNGIEGPKSNLVVVAVPCTPSLAISDGAPAPHPPTGPAYQAMVRLSWPFTCSFLPLTSYEVERRDSATAPWVVKATLPPTASSWTDPDPGSIAKNCYRIRATNSWGYSLYSNIQCSNAFLPL